MSSKRIPLSSNPNAANSPYRAVATAAASKHKRSYATLQREESYGHPPPAKRQMLDNHQPLKTPSSQQFYSSFEERLVARKNNASHQLSTERHYTAVRDKSAQQQVTRAERAAEEDLDSIKAWRKHYRKNFPKFVFYFESIPEEIRLKCTKHVVALGATVEKFFSNAVTHVVTSRSIPPEHEAETSPTSTTLDAVYTHNGPPTINPSLLENSNARLDFFAAKSRGPLQGLSSKRLGHANDPEPPRQQIRNTDVLYRARDLGMKIWALEKLYRMLSTMFNEVDSQTSHGHDTRSHTVQGPSAAPRARDADLAQLLKDERINGPSDRDPTVASKDMHIFKGPYIYIRDIDEKTRPIMVREYAKVTHKENGDWPQFRSVANGKCPFVGEVDHNQRELDKEKEARRLQKQQEMERCAAPKTRAATEASKMQPPRPVDDTRALAEMNNSNRGSRATSKPPTSMDKPLQKYRTEIESSSRGLHNAFVSRAGAGRLYGGEPVASGLQPSKVTSAIRSQMISSTAAQPGAKAGTNKEIHGLQRKVLEKNSGGPASYGLNSSHRMTDLSFKEDMSTRRKAHEKIGHIEEDTEPSEPELRAKKVESLRKAKVVQQRKHDKRDSKPGYCENCQDKFEDFEEHIQSRKHRKFAEEDKNWKDLDDLLLLLKRPLNPEYQSSPFESSQ